jgi:glutamate-ammonia-ligase adenylyltransferase
MKQRFEEFRRACPDVDEGFLKEYLSRLGNRYFSSFGEDDLNRHLKSLSRLSSQHPVEVLLQVRRDGSVDCTVLAFDYPFEFSIITGILAGMGFNIHSGEVFTYRPVPLKPSRPHRKKKLSAKSASQDLSARRRIIDHFSGDLDTALSYQIWADECRNNMETIIGLLESREEGSVKEAKQKVNEMVVERLAHLHEGFEPVLYPVQIEVDHEGEAFTRLKVVSEDTPAFLYALSNALSLHDILIENVKIRTIRGRVEDQLDLVDSRGRRITDQEVLDRIKLSVLLTKQFTYFLGRAPDPYTALSRFEHLLGNLLRPPSREKWLQLLADPNNLQDLARLLGASDFLWEDFIRLQYETLLPMFQPDLEGRQFSEPSTTLTERLDKALRGVNSFEEQKRTLNEFKDREIFLIDLDHILHPGTGFRQLAEKLSQLAETIVRKASELIFNNLVGKYGQPKTIAGLEAKFAILGLGKLGGAALGYASDIELLTVYGDNGQTDGEKAIENAEFFSYLARETAQFIEAKREGIFQVDLRLRPHGNAGPLACSLENFCRYYGQGGQAHSYERLALVRLRAVGGDPSLGSQMERLRDEIIYGSKSISFKELQKLRKRQFEEKTKGGGLNAKFSPGGLVDLEYGVQILQVMYGGDVPELRTPRIHEALGALTDVGVLTGEETTHLIRAYEFLRHLINGMRMLRGSAKDLFLPPVESDEFTHLARRMGYERGGPLDPTQQLYIEFETHTATVRGFFERHFGRDALPGQGTGTVADLILSEEVSQGMRDRILPQAGFKNPVRALVNLKSLAGNGERRETFAKLALLAWDILKRKPDPDMALNNWERFIHSLASPMFHYNLLLSQPMRLDILLGIFSDSQFLADTLIRNPGFFEWIMTPEILHTIRKRRDIEDELRKAGDTCANHKEWLNKLRRFRRREILRIGTRDICLGVPIRDVMLELSTLAEATVQVVFEKTLEKLKRDKKFEGETDELRDHICIIALGKLGGNELNYSSDIDLLGLWNDQKDIDGHTDDGAPLKKEAADQVIEKVRSDLSTHMEEGYAYRVDLRLRPFGREGELVPTFSGFLRYFGRSASLWEIQAALKMRPIAGNLRLGYDFLEKIRPILLEHRNHKNIMDSIEKMRNGAMKPLLNDVSPTVDVKSGFGGLRDVEFLVQGLQLIHGPNNPVLIDGNTLLSLDLLRENGILPERATDQLKEDYVFLRKTEHYLQLLEDRQTHALPKDPDQLSALAKRMLGSDREAKHFMDLMNECLKRIHDAFTKYLLDGEGSPNFIQ